MTTAFQSPCGEEVMKENAYKPPLVNALDKGFNPLAGKRS